MNRTLTTPNRFLVRLPSRVNSLGGNVVSSIFSNTFWVSVSCSRLSPNQSRSTEMKDTESWPPAQGSRPVAEGS